ncbi:MAG: HlyD family efflux transporter periplasmic adaptor subunit [Selenomonas ruminantium]|uniref:HlyD family efflux transporter periplasmic adaptor subunit n=1 Tax=Selenomonas ruminantium TaxID=971 RepID=A0A927ZRR7_SELRU|nr:HlyD family efflux transporter periplasmic adaptor subunit [Selenomonas ruminantium]MBE6084581.1 HlyD family efflux transporter periplasmic adaptor subunit [Selenomonas ruminantium]
MGAERWNQKGNEIFSKEALNKMRSPEKLDLAMSITTPIGWMGLIAVGAMVFAIVVWSVFGSFTVKADGMGMIMDSSGISTVYALSGGTVDEIYVHSGEKVEKGELIAHVNMAQEDAATRMAQYAPELAVSSREAATRVHEFDSRRYQKESAEYIYSPYDGTVDEILVGEGSIVSNGMPLIHVRIDGGRENFKGVLYIPVDKGKRVEKGQTIQLAPNGVDVSQTGSLLGTVRSVSQYPVTTRYMQKVLGNEQLAQWIISSQQSSVMEVNFDLVRDPGSESGYLWTSSVGVHKPITAGSFCRGSIIIERQPPIQKVFYKLSQWLRGR